MSDNTLTLSTVQSIGRAEIKKGTVAASVVAHPANANRDWSERGAVPAGILAAMGLSEHPAQQKTGPKGDQKETAYGTGFRVLADAVRALVREAKTPEAGVIRVSLSGEGGVTLTLREGDQGYAEAMALITATAEVAEAA